jgi:hypothetical protein
MSSKACTEKVTFIHGDSQDEGLEDISSPKSDEESSPVKFEAFKRP